MTTAVDDNVKLFEETATKLLGVASSMVKRQAAEKNVFSAAEKGREIMDKYIKGDKLKLEEVFGGTCERIGRYRQAYDSLSELGLEKDQRWGHLLGRIEAIEAILKDLGSFKPWTPGAVAAPESLKYKGLRRRVSPGRELRIRPELIGGACTFATEGDWPEGLILSAETGEITGKVASPTPEVKITVVAKNESGEIKSELTFAVLEPPPRGLKYPGLSGMLVVGANAVFQADFDAGVGRSFKVEPELPAGLALDEKSGVIHGAPTAPVAAKDYVVHSKNAGGECSATLNFGAIVPPPAELTYPTLPEELSMGRSVCFEPELESGIPTEFKVNPPLPEGLVLDKTTGTIRGTPLVAADPTEYVVTASNDGGKTGTAIFFSVKSTAPTSLTYPGIKDSYTNRTTLHLTPKVVGGAPDLFSVEPALPEGLVLSAATGEINGIPTLCEPSTWTITATNAAGTCSTVLSFGVTRAPPSSLSYPALEPVYAAKRMIELHPSVVGEVDSFTVSPALPDGLALDTATGVISGAPTGASPATAYEVTVKNEVGAATAKFNVEVRVLPPTGLSYPAADSMYHVGEEVLLNPQVDGGDLKFAVEPALPEGLALDPSTGVVSGSCQAVTDTKPYVVTVSNEGGQTTSTIEFRVEPCAPKSLSYPSLGGALVVGEQVDVDPEIDPGAFTFKVSPALPDGLSLNKKTGHISGSPTTELDEATYKVVASNVAGSVTAELTFMVTEPAKAAVIDTKFAEIIEEITDCVELLEKAPPKELRFGDWMIWMVHRAWLNDPTLTELNFNHNAMPLPHEEWRVAPKLMKALETNTHMEYLSLAQANVQKPQGVELAEALKKNCTLKLVNIESNNLDSACMQQIAAAIASNTNTQIAQLRLSYQIGMGQFYGRPVEEAFGEMMKGNTTITKLGLVIDDRHWLNTINGYLTRNADIARRKRKKGTSVDNTDELPSEDKTLSRVQLEKPPSTPNPDLQSNDNIAGSIFNKYLAQMKMLPNPSQLQSFARGAGHALKFSELKPTIESGRAQLLKTAQTLEVTVVDTFNAAMTGTLHKTEVKGSNWSVQIIQEGKLLKCKSDKDPAISVSPEWAAWLKGEDPAKANEKPASEE